MENNWINYKLGDIVEVGGGGTPKTKVEEYWNGDIEWLTPTDVTAFEGRFIRNTARKITKFGLNNSSAKLYDKGTLMMTSRATIGYPVINSVPMATNQGFINIKCGEKVHTLFLLYWIKNNKGHIENMATGTTFREISKKVFKEINIDLPSLKEQRKIVSILSSLDDKIELNNEMNKTLEEMAHAIFKSWFVDFEPFKDGKFEESELGRIPKGWNVGKVGDICDVSSSKRIFMADYKEIGIPFYRGKEIIEKSKGNEVSTRIYIDIDKFTEIKGKFGSPTKGDILLTSVGTIGIPYLVKDEEFYFKDGNLTWFKNFKVNGYNLYMYYWIKYGEGKNNIDKITIGSTQKALTISSLKDMKIIIPSDKDIYKFNNYVSGIVKRCEININENLYLKSIRDALLPKLISGEIKL